MCVCVCVGACVRACVANDIEYSSVLKSTSMDKEIYSPEMRQKKRMRITHSSLSLLLKHEINDIEIAPSTMTVK